MVRTENVQVTGETMSRTCDNPDCSNRVEWSKQPGRPQTFCSPNCRKRTRYAADRLRMTIKRLERARAANDLTYRQRRDLDAEIAQQRWLLSAYPSAFQA